ncbi:hypothetical protein BpHYR1_037727 [Brachionus plicatilis]|uniref:Uncharacterized protein n=1 Tax=Brachionus plicatilis TaxID=10195 RepID=A0A3M7SBG6_BRAPC|nr:hypothetical protein BpHYR1_037727 [Brachionus plicatilis]
MKSWPNSHLFCAKTSIAFSFLVWAAINFNSMQIILTKRFKSWVQKAWINIMKFDDRQLALDWIQQQKIWSYLKDYDTDEGRKDVC